MPCAARSYFDDLLGGGGGGYRKQLSSLALYFDFDTSPLSAINWMAKSQSAAWLRVLQNEGRPLTHDALDELLPGPARTFLRDLLVFTEVLPPRGHDFDDTGAWLRGKLAPMSSQNAATVRRFALWHLLRKARQRETRPSTKKRIRAKVMRVCDLLTWLEGSDRRLSSLRQRDVDEYLATRPPTTYLLLREFLEWTRKEGLTLRMSLPGSATGDPGQFLAQELRWTALRRSVSDDSVALHVRAAAALLLLYGITPMVIATLTCDQVETNAGKTTLRVGLVPLPLPDSVGLLIRAQIGQGRSPRDSPWIFPGQNPGRSISSNTLATSINKHLQVGARPARNAALASLARDLPVPVLAGYLNLTNTTAARWAERVQGQWDEYVEARKSQLEL